LGYTVPTRARFAPQFSSPQFTHTPHTHCRLPHTGFTHTRFTHVAFTVTFYYITHRFPPHGLVVRSHTPHSLPHTPHTHTRVGYTFYHLPVRKPAQHARTRAAHTRALYRTRVRPLHAHAHTHMPHTHAAHRTGACTARTARTPLRYHPGVPVPRTRTRVRIPAVARFGLRTLRIYYGSRFGYTRLLVYTRFTRTRGLVYFELVWFPTHTGYTPRWFLGYCGHGSRLVGLFTRLLRTRFYALHTVRLVHTRRYARTTFTHTHTPRCVYRAHTRLVTFTHTVTRFALHWFG